MSFLQEKQSRRYFIFIGIFIICLFLYVAFGAWMHGQESKAILLEREQAMVSSLLERGVAKDIIATSLNLLYSFLVFA